MLGILALDTRFERIVGDTGNAASYPFPVRIHVVEGADSPLIVRDGAPDAALVARFVAAAQALEAEGARAIISTCGFLVSVQDEIASAVNVPVMLSALSLYPLVATSGKGRVAILTASRAALGPRAMAAAGIDPARVVVMGCEDIPCFAESFLAPQAAQATRLKRECLEQALVEKSQEALRESPDIGAILLECGNLPPYARAIAGATGRPVFHMLDAAALLMRAQGQ